MHFYTYMTILVVCHQDEVLFGGKFGGQSQCTCQDIIHRIHPHVYYEYDLSQPQDTEEETTQ